jgi:hypothetical protein
VTTGADVTKHKNKKKKNAEEGFPAVCRTVTVPHLESFVYGFLQSRGYDLYPRIKETASGYNIALYFDRGEKGWWRLTQLELEGKESPAHFALGVALANHLVSAGIQPRTPAPIGEIVSKMMRNEILGQLQDGISNETAVVLLNNIAANMTRHLRPANMQIDFGDEDFDPGPKGNEEESEPVLLDDLEELEEASEDAAVAEGESLEDGGEGPDTSNVVELPVPEDLATDPADEVFGE